MAYREEGTLNTLAADSIIVKTDVVKELRKLTLSEAKISAQAIATRLGVPIDDITAATSIDNLITAVESIDDAVFSANKITEKPSEGQGPEAGGGSSSSGGAGQGGESDPGTTSAYS